MITQEVSQKEELGSIFKGLVGNTQSFFANFNMFPNISSQDLEDELNKKLMD